MKIYVDCALQAESVATRRKAQIKSLTLVGEMGLATGRSDPGRPPPLVGPFNLIDFSQDLYMHQGAEYFWGDWLDEMRFWNVLRSAEEIIKDLSTTCKGSRGVTPLSGSLLLCYSFDSVDLQIKNNMMYFTDHGLLHLYMPRQW